MKRLPSGHLEIHLDRNHLARPRWTQGSQVPDQVAKVFSFSLKDGIAAIGQAIDDYLGDIGVGVVGNARDDSRSEFTAIAISSMAHGAVRVKRAPGGSPRLSERSSSRRHRYDR